MYIIDITNIGSVKKQSINKTFNETIKSIPHSICTYIISADREDSLNTDKQTNKQTVLTATSHYFSTNINGLYFSTNICGFCCRLHVR